MIEPSPLPETFRDLQRQLTRMRLQAMISGRALPPEFDGMNLHHSALDAERAGRIRFSYRATDHAETEDAACLERHAASPENE